VIEALFLAALAFAVVPLLDRVPPEAALVAVGLLAVAFLAPTGPVGAALALPWLGVAAAIAIGRGADLSRSTNNRPLALDRLPNAAASAFLLVGAVFAVLSRLGVQPLGIGEPIVLLTAVHFHVAGFVLLTAANRMRPEHRAAATASTATLIAGIPVTALGFLGLPVAGLVGSLLVAAAGLAVGLLHLAVARAQEGSARALAAVAGTSLVVSMPLAAAWAVTSFAAIPFLPVAAMAATHGTFNAVGFAIPAAWLWRGTRPITALRPA
jgi:hypothetical protein